MELLKIKLYLACNLAGFAVFWSLGAIPILAGWVNHWTWLGWIWLAGQSGAFVGTYGLVYRWLEERWYGWGHRP